MAVPAFFTWDRIGRPLQPATPIKDLVERLRVAFPRGAKAGLFSWFADETHYRAVPALDHTPYSGTGWPLASPRWVVFATDVGHRPDLGVDCTELFAYWIAEARVGRMPWLKYLIWRRRVYDVRNRWEPQPATGHEDHIHLSARTDHQHTHLGNWSVVPEGDDMTPQQEKLLRAIAARVNASVDGVENLVTDWSTVDPKGTQHVWLVQQVKALVAAAAADQTRDAATLAAIQALANSTGVNAAPVIAAIREEAEKTRALVEELQQENTELRARLAELTDSASSSE